MDNKRLAQILTKRASIAGGAAAGGAFLPIIGSALGAHAEKDENRSYRGSPAFRAGAGSAMGAILGALLAKKIGKRYLVLPYLGNIVGGALGAGSVKSKERMTAGLARL